MRPLARAAIRAGQVLLIVLGLAGLVGSAMWLRLEDGWTAAESRSDGDAFRHGTLGLEFAPLKYVLVMGTVSAKSMTKQDTDANGQPLAWQSSFGFLPNPSGQTAGTACVSNAAEYLPVGFSISHLLQGSAGGSPVPFVGLTCAACHSSQVQMPGQSSYGDVLYGVGNTRLDLIAWTDAFRNSLQDPALTADAILDAYKSLGCNDDDAWSRWPLRYLERFIVSSWLDGVHAQMSLDNSKYDLPYWGAELNSSQNMPAGPLRTRPFRSIVRNGLDLPGEGNLALSKIPVVFEQGMKERSQFDGSIGDPVVRSMVAAFASGSSIEALSKPIVYENIRAAARYTLTLGRDDYGLYGYDTTFADPQYAITAAAQHGGEVYRDHCASCHGMREDGHGAWVTEGYDQVGKRNLIGTDTARVDFRYTRMLPDALYLQLPASPIPAADKPSPLDEQTTLVAKLAQDASAEGRGADAAFWVGLQRKLQRGHRLYPAGHPLTFAHDVLEADPGYLNSPLPYAWLRAPYLHNGSIPTLAQLINLEKRPTAFCRGDNAYDPVNVGILAPDVEKPSDCTGKTPYFFDTRLKGNGNAGHDYPWRLDEVPGHEADLRDLLEYMKTL